ncbi:MAG TPA: preprotein translocase subunit SecG [Chitinophagaceae bacterium]|jgi:preprotein translocase subunit SecG|nr:preprotein translocase subunit SecG [Chitinophagaceae bacterium]
MTLFFVILIILACVILGFIVLVQNPKGGGLAGNIAGFSNQFMGVKQTNDVLEKGTWIFAAVVGILCIISTFFMSGGDEVQDRIDTINPYTNQQRGTGGLPGGSAAPAPGTPQQQTNDTNR